MLHDFRFALRQLLKSPGFTAVAVLTLALGIGANTAIFSLLNTIMLRPLPYPEPGRLVRIFSTSPQSQSWPHSVANFLDHQEQNKVFEHMAAFRWWRFSLAEPGEPADSLRGILATADLFPALGVRAAHGRVFTAEEDQPGSHQVVVLSHSFWVRRFAADTNIVGRTLRIDGEKVSVIGVMPAAFDFPQLWGPIDAWRPLAFTAEQRENRRDQWLNVVARLKGGVSLSQAQTHMKLLAFHLAAVYPQSNDAHHSLRVAPLHESIGDVSSRRFAWLLLGLTGFVLLIACVNLANLQLARATTRSREMAVRLALGVGRWRLMRQLLSESLLVALVGGAFGVVLASWLSSFIGSHINHPFLPNGLAVTLDFSVLFFALISSVVTGLLFGVAPAWLASRTNTNDVLKAGTRGATPGRAQHRLRHALIVGEVALALVLLMGAGLFMSGLERFIRQDPGWRVDGLMVGWLPQTGSKYASSDQRRAFVERLEQRLSAVPGVERVAVSSALPIWAFGSSRPFLIENHPPPPSGQEPLVYAEAVSPGYFDTLGIRLRQGRLFTAADAANRPDVVIINEAMARHFWPGESAIGKRIGGYDRANPDPGWQEIVGVVNNIRCPANLGRPDTLWQMYRPLAQEPRAAIVIAVRTAGPAQNVALALRHAVAELDPDLPLNELEAARTTVDRLLVHFRLSGIFLGAFAILGLVLAALGIYGVVSCFVVQRTNEIGVRMALGAQRRDVLWLVLGKGLLLSLLGILLGLAGAFVVARLLSAAVPELHARDALAFIGVSGAATAAWVATIFVAIALIIVALLACLFPARRATKIDPIAALRYE